MSRLNKKCQQNNHFQVKTLKEHQLLVEKAKAKNVLLQIEVLIKFSIVILIVMMVATSWESSFLPTLIVLVLWPSWLFFSCTRNLIQSTAIKSLHRYQDFNHNDHIMMMIIRSTRDLTPSTATHGWEFRNLVSASSSSSSSSLSAQHSHPHHHYHYDCQCRWVQLLHQLHEPAQVPAWDLQGKVSLIKLSFGGKGESILMMTRLEPVWAVTSSFWCNIFKPLIALDWQIFGPI